MCQAAHHYLIFETRGGFCGITWNNVGTTRFQLPAKSAEGAQRMLLRRDALSYALHRAFHASTILWRLQALHHADPELDVSTTLRHHPGRLS
jgi:sterol desaturase/sphingolipid hydroxylase (fatty acid hydroxylase superfamily)